MILYRIHGGWGGGERLCDEASSILEHEEKNLLFIIFWQAETIYVVYVVGYN